MPFSAQALDDILQDRFRADVTPPATVYVALMEVLPDQAGAGGTEVTGTDYARQAISRGTGSWSAPGAGTGSERVITNASPVDFGVAGDDWAPPGNEAVGFAIYTAATGGTYLGKGTFSQPLVIQTGNPVQFDTGALEVTAEPGA